MRSRRGREPEEEEDWEDREDPEEADQDEDDDPGLVPCPYCRHEVSEDAELCPHCGSFVSIEDAPPKRPRWIVISTLLLIVVILVAWVAKGM